MNFLGANSSLYPELFCLSWGKKEEKGQRHCRGGKTGWCCTCSSRTRRGNTAVEGISEAGALPRDAVSPPSSPSTSAEHSCGHGSPAHRSRAALQQCPASSEACSSRTVLGARRLPASGLACLLVELWWALLAGAFLNCPMYKYYTDFGE